MFDLVVSLVIYETPEEEVLALIDLLASTQLVARIVVVDNSTIMSYPRLRADKTIEYIRTEANLGYGTANNIAISRYIHRCRYFLILNADVSFKSGTLEAMLKYMDGHPDVAHCMPKVVGTDESMHYLCRLLPTPVDVIIRAVFRSGTLLRMVNNRYELRTMSYENTISAPFLSGCFMFLRAAALRDVGAFDERFFLYAEDIDLTRRLHMRFKTVLFPHATITHIHRKESFRSRRMFLVHMQNMVRYFNKWGWFIDHDRRAINARCRSQIQPGQNA
jgi:GT2 family glycosyltransferase